MGYSDVLVKRTIDQMLKEIKEPELQERAMLFLCQIAQDPQTLERIVSYRLPGDIPTLYYLLKNPLYQQAREEIALRCQRSWANLSEAVAYGEYTTESTSSGDFSYWNYINNPPKEGDPELRTYILIQQGIREKQDLPPGKTLPKDPVLEPMEVKIVPPSKTKRLHRNFLEVLQHTLGLGSIKE